MDSTDTYSEFLKGKRVALIGPSESIEGASQGEFVDSHDVVVRMVRPVRHVPTAADMEIVPKRLQKDIGTTSHVVYSNFDGVCLNDNYLNHLVERGVKYFNSTRPAEYGNNSINDYKPLLEEAGLLSCAPPIPKYENWSDSLKASPCSGFCILLDLLSHDVKELYVFGYSFHKDLAIKEWLSHNNVTREWYRNDNMGEGVSGIHQQAPVSESDDITKWKREVNSRGQHLHNHEKERIYFKKEILAKDPRVIADNSMIKFL